MKATLIPLVAVPLLFLSCTGQQEYSVHVYHLKSSAPRPTARKQKPYSTQTPPIPRDEHFFVYYNDEILKQNGEKHVEISLASQRGVFYVNGQVAMDFPVCTGKTGYETPTGNYTIKEKKRHHRSNIYHVSMPCFMRLTLLYFSGKLLLFDVQSSTTEKVQKARYHLHLRRGGARRLAWE